MPAPTPSPSQPPSQPPSRPTVPGRGGSSTARSPRERMVWSAAQRIRRDGVTATGLRAVVADAGAPRGSLQHYFPHGKDQLVDEALQWSQDHAVGHIRRYLASARRPTPSGLFAAMVRPWVDEYERHGYDAGCPAAATVVDCARGSDQLREAAARTLDGWRDAAAEGLVVAGVPRRRSRALADLALGALEGAIVLARARRSSAPLRAAVRELGPLLDAAADDRGPGGVPGATVA